MNESTSSRLLTFPANIAVERVRKHLKTFDPEAAVDIKLDARRIFVDGAADRTNYAFVIRDAGFTPT